VSIEKGTIVEVVPHPSKLISTPHVGAIGKVVGLYEDRPRWADVHLPIAIPDRLSHPGVDPQGSDEPEQASDRPYTPCYTFDELREIDPSLDPFTTDQEDQP
jgi:hypothetical protein